MFMDRLFAYPYDNVMFPDEEASYDWCGSPLRECIPCSVSVSGKTVLHISNAIYAIDLKSVHYKRKLTPNYIKALNQFILFRNQFAYYCQFSSVLAYVKEPVTCVSLQIIYIQANANNGFDGSDVILQNLDQKILVSKRIILDILSFSLLQSIH